MKLWWRSNQRGQGLIEMALLAALLILLLAGVVDIGRAFNSYIVVTNASREGARYGSRFPADGNGIVNAAKQEVAGSAVAQGDLVVTPACYRGGGAISCGIAESGDSIVVSTQYSFDVILGQLVGSSQLTLNHKTEMVVFGLD